MIQVRPAGELFAFSSHWREVLIMDNNNQEALQLWASLTQQFSLLCEVSRARDRDQAPAGPMEVQVVPRDVVETRGGPDQSTLAQAVRAALNTALAQGDCQTALRLTKVFRGIETTASTHSPINPSKGGRRATG